MRRVGRVVRDDVAAAAADRVVGTIGGVWDPTERGAGEAMCGRHSGWR